MTVDLWRDRGRGLDPIGWGGTSGHVSGGTHPFCTGNGGTRAGLSVRDQKPEQGGGIPSCAQGWGAGARTQDPSRDRGRGLDPIGWGVYPMSASGGVSPCCRRKVSKNWSGVRKNEGGK